MRGTLRNLFLNVVGAISRPSSGIHIINSHYVTPFQVIYERDVVIFDEYLRYLSVFAEFIDLKEAVMRIMKRNIPRDRVLIAFTYDDGYEECGTIIAPLLEKYGTRGTFFINANYIDSSSQYQEGYNGRNVASTPKRPMTWTQVENLHNRGHLIGSHNLDHMNFTELTNLEIDYQVSENKRILEERLHYNCEYFAWSFGQLKHFSEMALRITQKYHSYIFSGTNYCNYFSYEGQVFNRRHQEAYWPRAHNRYFLSRKRRFS